MSVWYPIAITLFTVVYYGWVLTAWQKEKLDWIVLGGFGLGVILMLWTIYIIS